MPLLSRTRDRLAVVLVVAAIATVVAVVALRRNDTSAPARGTSTAASSAPATTPTGRTLLAGFTETHITVMTPNGALGWCLLLAETAAQQNRGLMQVTDPTLGGYDGMLFRFAKDTSVAFYMRNTPMPLSIAFVAANGHVVSTADMAPCADRDGCPLYQATAPYRVAIEVPQGRLERLGIDTSATVVDDARAC